MQFAGYLQIGCSDPFPLAGHFCENPSFPLNPHYALRDTDADNIISNSLLAQRLAWSISDHYSSLDSFTVNILNSSNSDTPNMDLLVNVSQFIQQSIFPFLGDIQVSKRQYRITTHMLLSFLFMIVPRSWLSSPCCDITQLF